MPTDTPAWLATSRMLTAGPGTTDLLPAAPIVGLKRVKVIRRFRATVRPTAVPAPARRPRATDSNSPVHRTGCTSPLRCRAVPRWLGPTTHCRASNAWHIKILGE
ncbi:hypothetical protein GCM10022225_00070 [Plantactinospora mayteni]|uniref:Uncharacterized protein n=1 Tax=Plantactinospora mayteni TaxID=566021 RepID=A0ABQ4EYP2_9ACTN|nr:hypothetical protein Pma05_63380 [Plantactinospora mayteni]